MACIYVACGRDGLVKVGQTNDFKRRITSLKKEFKRFGNEILRSACFEVLTKDAAYFAERRLLNKLDGHLQQYSGREWFVGDAQLAMRAAEIAAQEEVFRKPRPVFKPLAPGESERLRLLRAKEREDRAQAHAAFMEKRKAETQARRDLRELRRKEIVEREAIRLGLIQQAA